MNRSFRAHLKRRAGLGGDRAAIIGHPCPTRTRYCPRLETKGCADPYTNRPSTREPTALATLSSEKRCQPNVAARLALRATSRRSDLAVCDKAKRVSLQTFRHTTAMHLLQARVDLSVIALWLGHESPATTHQYLAADLAMKERALAAVEAPRMTATRFKPGDRLLTFLDRL
ncbi:MAG: hypothetical protein E6J66_07285 [Deltaproteobacteria bacterium]|nr:MAG: hypothetical protein E6J66_07285 [Deltaproteobacteria bacterium]